MHAEGAQTVIVDLNEERGAALVEELGDGAVFVRADVSDPAAVEKAISTAAEGNLRIAVSCAGIGIAEKTVGRTGAHSLEHFEIVIRINLIGTFNVLRLAAQAMVANEPADDGQRGVIVNTASIAAFDGQIGQIAYAASKGGVASLTLPAARDLARHGVRVVAIAPGLFDTPLLRLLPEEARQALAESIPFPHRLGKPSEYADLVASIVGNPMINGETIRIDGALRMAPR